MLHCRVELTCALQSKLRYTVRRTAVLGEESLYIAETGFFEIILHRKRVYRLDVRGINIESVGVYSKRGGVGSLDDDTSALAELLVGCVAEPDYLLGLEVLDYLTDKYTVEVVNSCKESSTVAAYCLESLAVAVINIGLVDVHALSRDIVLPEQREELSPAAADVEDSLLSAEIRQIDLLSLLDAFDAAAEVVFKVEIVDAVIV